MHLHGDVGGPLVMMQEYQSNILHEQIDAGVATLSAAISRVVFEV